VKDEGVLRCYALRIKYEKGVTCKMKRSMRVQKGNVEGKRRALHKSTTEIRERSTKSSKRGTREDGDQPSSAP